MNTFVGTTDAAFLALQSPSKFGLWAGSVPTTLQQPATNKQARISTVVGLTLASMFSGIGFVTHELPPTYADTTSITTTSYIIEKRGSAPFGYAINQSQVAFVTEYLHQYVTSRDFLRDIAVIIDGIYGSKVVRNIHVVDDVDTGKPIMELTIQSGLPLDDEFDRKDQLLFQRIDAAGLAWGLRDVVITQG